MHADRTPQIHAIVGSQILALGKTISLILPIKVVVLQCLRNILQCKIVGYLEDVQMSRRTDGTEDQHASPTIYPTVKTVKTTLYWLPWLCLVEKAP